MANVRLFGLEVDASGALRTIRQVGESGAQMARDGAKNAQLYADAFHEKLNRVARQYIPETMRAIDALRERQRTLSVAGAAPLSGLLSPAELQEASRRYDAMRAALDGVTDTAKRSGFEMGRLRSSITSVAAAALGSAPGVAQFGSVVGSLAIGSALTIGVMAGLAAIGFAWHALTKEAREAGEAADKAIAKLREANRLSQLGPGGEIRGQIDQARARLATAEAARADLQRQAIIERTTGQGIVNPATTAALAQRVKEIADLQSLITTGEQRLSEAVGESGTALAQRTVSDLATIITAHKATAAEIRNAEALVTSLERTLDSLTGNGSKAAERAQLIAQIKQLNEALHPKKEASDAKREAERAAKEAQEIADKQANARNQLAIDEIRKRADARKAAEKEADATAKHIAEVAAEEQRRNLHELDRLLRSTFSSLFTDIFAQGKGAFESLFDAIRRGFARLISDLLAAQLSERIARSALGGMLGMLVPGAVGAQGNGIGASNYLNGLGGQIAVGAGASALGGGLAGFGTGAALYSSSHGSLGNTARGAFGGAASGALTGAMIGSAIGPIGAAAGAAIGGITGLVGGILGMGSASKAAAKAMSEAAHAVVLSQEALHANVSGDTLAEQIAAINADRAARAKAIEDAWSGGGANSDRVRWRTQQLALMNAEEDKLIAKRQREFEQAQTYAREDLEVRKLRAEGHTKEADALARKEAADREIAQAIADHRSDEYLATLRYVTGLELATNAMDKATASAVNMVEGYKLQAQAYRVMASGPQASSLSGGGYGNSYTPRAPLAVPTGASRGTPQPTEPVILQPVQFTVDGRVFAEGMLKQYGAGQTGGNLKVAFGDLVQRVLPA